MQLYTYYRSPASYRVRIALHLKKQKYTHKSVHLVKNGGEQHTAEYKELNPQELVPTLVDGKTVLTQSLAIIEYLDEKKPEPPLLPQKPADRAFARQIAHICAVDTHPFGTLRVLNYMSGELAVSQTQKTDWQKYWISKGFDAIEYWLDKNTQHKNTFVCGNTPTLADICLIPQVYEARRLEMDIAQWPKIEQVEKRCLKLEAFQKAAPEEQPDTPDDQRPDILKNRVNHGG
ncbi:MAG: maleylacetoacetate isomerase [Alphaproteobacteria bacterium]|nr:maleylacetoacetate isomerase [Alphaproteobacteria bacterium]